MIRENMNLTNKALAFQAECEKLVGHVLTNTYYEFNVHGFLNTRNLQETRFEYIPLSKLFFETQLGTFISFFDSTRFLEDHGYYTLDIKIESSLDSELIESNQTRYTPWSKFLNKEIKNVDVIWSHLYRNYHRGNPSDIYPRGLEIHFSEGHSIVIVASEFEMVGNKYNFMCPDEALIVCFSRDTYDSILGDGS